MSNLKRPPMVACEANSFEQMSLWAERGDHEWLGFRSGVLGFLGEMDGRPLNIETITGSASGLAVCFYGPVSDVSDSRATEQAVVAKFSGYAIRFTDAMNFWSTVNHCLREVQS